MDPAEFREEKIPVAIRGSDPSLGVAGEAMLASFRSQGMSDAEIEATAPNLLEAVAQPVTPTTVVQARYGFWDYTIENDAGVVVTGADLVSFLQSKDAPEEVIYAIINRLPMPATAQTRGDGDSGHDWRDIKATVRITGSASATTGFPRNQVNGTVEFEVVIEANLGQIESGGEDAVEKVSEIAESASNLIQERLEQRVNGEDDGDGDGDDGDDDGPSVVETISLKVLTYAIWFVIRETQPLR